LSIARYKRFRVSTARRHDQESRELALEADLAEVNGLLQDAVRLIDELLARLDELEGNSKNQRRRRRKPATAEPIDLPNFLGPKRLPAWPDLVFSQPLATRR
jgi:hypothetical protein